MKTSIASTLIVAAALAIGSLSLIAQEEENANKASAWEHLALQRDASEPFSDPEFAGKIVELGKEGWELVTVENFAREGTTTKTVYFFKRPL